MCACESVCVYVCLIQVNSINRTESISISSCFLKPVSRRRGAYHYYCRFDFCLPLDFLSLAMSSVDTDASDCVSRGLALVPT